MDIKEIYYRKLVEGYLKKTLTKRELVVFFDLLAKGELDFYLEEDMLDAVPAYQETKAIPFYRHIKWRNVAAILVLSLSLGFLIYHEFERRDIAKTAPELTDRNIIPGGNNAVLTLENGQQIILDNASHDDIEGGELVEIDAEKGVLKYDLTKLNLDLNHTALGENKYHTLETPRGGTYHLVLSDGTNVWLNSLSKIKFPLSFSASTREVEIEGEVYFDVAKRNNQNFIVHTKKQKIEVLGTSFNVNAYGDEPFVRTTLAEGSIKLIVGNTTVKLKPGEEALNLNGQLKIQNADLDQALAWKDGYFRFDKVDIKTLMRQMSRWYNVNIKYVGEISDERFVGKIKRTENIQELINIFNQGGMEISISDRTIIVKK